MNMTCKGKVVCLDLAWLADGGETTGDFILILPDKKYFMITYQVKYLSINIKLNVDCHMFYLFYILFILAKS